MNPKLMNEFEEFEGLGNQIIDETIITDTNDDDDPSFRPTNATTSIKSVLRDFNIKSVPIFPVPKIDTFIFFIFLSYYF